MVEGEVEAASNGFESVVGIGSGSGSDGIAETELSGEEGNGVGLVGSGAVVPIGGAAEESSVAVEASIGVIRVDEGHAAPATGVTVEVFVRHRGRRSGGGGEWEATQA